MTDTASPYNLIELARRLLPEGEDLNFADLDLTVEEIAHLRSELSAMRSAIDRANLALAAEFERHVPPGYATLLEGGMLARVSRTTPQPRWVDDTGEMFALWLKDQPVDFVRSLVSRIDNNGVVRPRLSGMPRTVRDTFVVFRREESKPSLSVSPIEQVDTRWVQGLHEGDIARWNRQTRQVEYLSRKEDPDVEV